MALPVAVGGGSPAVANTNAASSIGVSVAQVATGEPTGCSPHVVSLSRGDVRCHHNKILTWWSLFLVLCQPGPVPTRPAPVALVRSSRVSPRLVSLSETLSRGDADCHRDQMLTDVAVAPLRCPLPPLRPSIPPFTSVCAAHRCSTENQAPGDDQHGTQFASFEEEAAAFGVDRQYATPLAVLALADILGRELQVVQVYGAGAGHVELYAPTTELSSGDNDGEPLKLVWDCHGVHFWAVVAHNRVLR